MEVPKSVGEIERRSPGCSKALLNATDMILADMDERKIIGARNMTSEFRGDRHVPCGKMCPTT